MSNFIRHDACPSCGSADNLAIYEDHEHCFSEGCGYHKNYKNSKRKDRAIAKIKYDLKELPSKTMPALKSRGLDSSTVNKYRVTVNIDKESNIEAIFPKFDPATGDHIFNQVRYADKEFSCEGDTKKSGLFGQQLFPSGGKSITLTEGYYDTLSAFQLTGSRYPNVGVMSASSAKKEVVTNFEYLDSFESIIINFDSDEPGQKAAKECAQLFAPGKVRILKLEKGKDPNDYLVNGYVKEYINEWFRAPAYMPDGLLLGNNPELLDEIVNYKEPESVPYPWEGLNRATYGLRLSELTLFTADTGIGKTTFMKEIEYKLLTDEELVKRGYGVGFLHLEELKRDTALGLMSIHKNKPYHLPDTEKSKEELTEVYNELVNTERVVIYDHFGSNDIDVVLSKIRHMTALGCRYIVIDHLSIIVSDQSGDERKQLDEISTKLKTLTMNLNICVIAVIHINRQGQVRGSAGPEQVSNNVIRLERDKREKDEWRRNVTRIFVEKCRLSGRTGPAAWVWYNPITGRLQEMDSEEIERFESGGGDVGHEFERMS
jgi:twinkle protein